MRADDMERVRQGLSHALILAGARLSADRLSAGSAVSDLDEKLKDLEAARQWLKGWERGAIVLVLSRGEHREIVHAIQNTIDDGTWRDEWVLPAVRKDFDNAVAKLISPYATVVKPKETP